MALVSVFFQAEDGIRDSSVAGVQTCALPIFAVKPGRIASHRLHRDGLPEGLHCFVVASGLGQQLAQVAPGARVARLEEIGRASCRERVEISGVAVSLKKK